MRFVIKVFDYFCEALASRITAMGSSLPRLKCLKKLVCAPKRALCDWPPRCRFLSKCRLSFSVSILLFELQASSTQTDRWLIREINPPDKGARRHGKLRLCSCRGAPHG